jgi:hypothetical protein
LPYELAGPQLFDPIIGLTIPYTLAFCGDGFVGGRVHLAMEHGILVAQRIRDKKGILSSDITFPTLADDIFDDNEEQRK